MQALVYKIFYGILWSISLLPMPVLYFLASGLRLIAQYVIGYRKQVIHDNLLLVFPEKSEAERKKIASQYYLHLCDLVVETIKSLTISEAELKRRYVIDNLDISDEYYKEGKSVLVFCSHYANWEWSIILGAQIPFKGYGVYKTIKIKYFDKLIRRIRGRFGGTIVTNKNIVIALYRSFRKGEQTVTLILADQSPKRSAIKKNALGSFMGINVPVFTGAEELAKRLDFSVVYLSVKKERRGYYRATVVPLAKESSTVPDYKITRAFLNEIEKQIADEPAYYLWSHKRWKYRDGVTT
jgi:KDO2-lipid IV(A) lauroyltransferase